MRPLTTLELANEELRQVRRELGRGDDAPLRLVVAGDPTKPVWSFTLPRRLPATLAAGVAVSVLATILSNWGGPAKALAALSSANLYAAPLEDAHVRDENTFKSEAALSASAQLDPVPPTAQMHAVAEPEHFTVEISNTGKVIEVHLGGPAGEPDEESYRALRHELRCQRSGAESPIDPRLIEILHQISVNTGQRIQVVSAFRGPGRPGDFNYHTRGMAADIRVPGVDTADLRDLAKSLGATGVGYYPTVQFVHVDVRGTPYFWTDTSGHGDHSRHENTPADSSEGAEPDEPVAANAAPELSAEVAAILRAPSSEPAAAAPISPVMLPVVGPSPRAKAAGEVQTAELAAKPR